jgi:hypothetical protein
MAITARVSCLELSVLFLSERLELKRRLNSREFLRA